jgi:hypothetical protein
MAAVPDGTEQDRAVLSETPGGGLHIELVKPDGGRIAERDLGRTGPCWDLASASAVVIATWEAQLRPQRVRPVKLAADEDVRASGAGAPPTATYDAGVSGLGSLAGGQAAAGLLVDGSWAPAGYSLGVYGSAEFTTTRDTAVGGFVGTVGYWRPSAGLGPRYRLAGRDLRADLHAALLAGWLSMKASGLTTNDSDSVGQLGADAGLRIGPAWDGLVPWVGLGAQYWPGHEHMQVNINGALEQHDVPRFDLRLTVGVSLGHFE